MRQMWSKSRICCTAKRSTCTATRGIAARRIGIDCEGLQWHIAAQRSQIEKMLEGRAKTKAQKEERRKASVRARVEHPSRVIKRQFGLTKVADIRGFAVEVRLRTCAADQRRVD